MKLRLSFTLKILLPYLIIAVLFLLLFLSELDQGHGMVIWLSAIGLVFTFVAAILHIFWLKTPLNRIRNLVARLTRGTMPEFTASSASDEIGDLERNLEVHVDNLKNIMSFAGSMASGDFTGRFDKLSNEDELGEALLSLKGSLMESLKESESRRREEQNRTWSAQGLAKFGDLFRVAEDNLTDLSQEFMKELVDYTAADVGALFIRTAVEGDESPVLELYGTFAFDREKYIHRSFQFGEGLVGRTAVEKEIIHITEVPPDYIKIRSGLGEDVPSTLLFIPVMLDQQVLGVIELASLGEIPGHQIDFLRQLGDALAATLAKVKANLQTRKLFEQSMKQAEELEKAQKDARKREEKLQQEIDSLRKPTS